MIFKNFSDSASQLLSKINDEVANPTFTFISPDAKSYCQLVSQNLFDIGHLPLDIHNLAILDDGSTRASEFTEYTDRIHKLFPATKIIIAIPAIPESEKGIFESMCDTLIYLHSEPLFFSVSQFYQTSA